MASTIFRGSELVFKQTYFSEPKRTVRIKTDAPVSSLGAREVPRSAGSFAFARGDPGLHNRFIVWRANGPNLYLEEFSVERDLPNASLCVNFSQSTIIPGTVLCQLERSLVVVVPTQSGINRFTIPLQDVAHGPLSITQSVLSLFPAAESGLARSHSFHPLSHVASKAAIGVLADGTMVAAISTDDKQLVRVTLHSSQAKADETLLEGVRMLHYIKLGTWSQVWDACIGMDDEGRRSAIYSVHHDATLRVWKPTSGTAVFTVSLAELLRVASKSPVVEAAIKMFNFPEQSRSAVVLKLQSSSACEFSVLEVVGDKLVKRSWCRLEAKHIVDYICTPPSTVAEQFSLWAITSRDSPPDERQPLQPYVLKRCSVSMSVNVDSIWEEVSFGLGDEQVSSTLFESTRQEAICGKIFDGDHFSPEVVRRAIETVREVASDLEGVRSMQDLRDYVTTRLDSLPRVAVCDSFGPGHSTGEAVNQKKEKFWGELYLSCVQLQEMESRPFAFLYSARQGIVGVIQQSRFTVYLPPDEEMRLMVGQHDKMLTSLFQVFASSPSTDITEVLKGLDAEKSLTTIAECIDEFSCFIETLAEHSPWEAAPNLIENNSSHLASSLSTTLLAMALRQRVMARLCFMDAIGRLLQLLPHVTATSTELRVNPRLDLVLNSHNCKIAEFVSCYMAMWETLSESLGSRSRTGKERISIAQAFFKYGGSKFVKKTHHTRAVLSNADVQMEVQEEEDDAGHHSAGGSLPPSRWDKSTFLIDPTEAGIPTGGGANFVDFVRETVAASITSLWPKSSSLLLPRFLLDNCYYNGLAKLCATCESTSPEMANALRFLQAVALSGMGKPDEAWTMFNEVALSVLTKDRALNGLLSELPFAPDNRAGRHSLAEYFFKVMKLFVAHNHPAFVSQAGDKALHCSNDDVSLLPELLTTLFTHHLAGGNAEEALRTLLKNPDGSQQMIGLRQLLTNLLDTRRTRLLVDLSYGRLTEAMAEMLEARCRASVHPIEEKNAGIHEVTFAFHVARFNYDRAASVMHHLAQRLRNEVQTVALLEWRCRVLAVVHQTMQVLPPSEQQFVAMDEVESDEKELPRYNFTRQSTSVTTEGNGTAEQQAQHHHREGAAFAAVPQSNTVHKEEIQRELVKAEARTQLIQLDPANLPSLDVEQLLSEAIRRDLFDMGWVLIREFGLSPHKLLEYVCTKSLSIDALQLDNDKVEWITANRQYVVDYDEKLKPHWKVVVSYVDLALQQSPSDTGILHTVADTFLKFSVKIPPWLESRYKRVNFGDLLLLLVQYEEKRDAFDMLLPYIDLAISKVSVGETDFLLPMTQIKTLLHYAKMDNELASCIDKTNQMITKLEATRVAVRRFDGMIGQDKTRSKSHAE